MVIRAVYKCFGTFGVSRQLPTMKIVFFIFLFQVDIQASKCPEHVDSQIQKCIEESGMYNLGQTLGTIITNGIDNSGFCTGGKSSAIVCIEDVINNCANHTEQRQMMTLMVDVHKLRTNFNYFCENLNILSANKSCFSSLYHVGDCVEKTTSTMRKTPQHWSVKNVLDNLCQLFSSISTCYSISFPATCNMTSQLFSRLFNGARYPYCDLSEVQREMRLAELMYNASPSSFNVYLSFVFVFVGLLCNGTFIVPRGAEK
ncbi:hypothetical protein SNE40_013949 [Patella caerulea]|uniref:Uncharacterized protein n=1 Tax=Patella caerulea TaxID=87958 RepID=A0AAN8JKA3_PATCE